MFSLYRHVSSPDFEDTYTFDLSDSNNRGFDVDMIMAITTLARTPGIMAHWRESLCKSTHPIPLTFKPFLLD